MDNFLAESEDSHEVNDKENLNWIDTMVDTSQNIALVTPQSTQRRRQELSSNNTVNSKPGQHQKQKQQQQDKDPSIEKSNLHDCINVLRQELQGRKAKIKEQYEEIQRLRKALQESEQMANHLADEIILYWEEKQQGQKRNHSPIDNQEGKAALLVQSPSETALLPGEIPNQVTPSHIPQTFVMEFGNSNASKQPHSIVVEDTGDQQVDAIDSNSINRIDQGAFTVTSSPTERFGEEHHAIDCRIVSPSPLEITPEISLQRSLAGLLIRNVLRNRERADVGSYFRKWSAHTTAIRATSHHIQMAETIHQHLHMTQAKLSALKSFMRRRFVES